MSTSLPEPLARLVRCSLLDEYAEPDFAAYVISHRVRHRYPLLCDAVLLGTTSVRGLLAG